MYLWFSIFEVQLVYSLVNDAFHIEILMRMYSGGFFKKERPIIEVKCVTKIIPFSYIWNWIGIWFLWLVSDAVSENSLSHFLLFLDLVWNIKQNANIQEVFNKDLNLEKDSWHSENICLNCVISD